MEGFARFEGEAVGHNIDGCGDTDPLVRVERVSSGVSSREDGL